MRALRYISLLAFACLALLPQGAQAGSSAGTIGSSKIVFTRIPAGSSNHDIYVANADGSGAVDITNNAADDVDPAISPDGTRVAFSSNRGGTYDLYVVSVNGGVPIRITNNVPGNEIEPSWSPDGNTIAYAYRSDPNDPTTTYDIWTVGADGSGPSAVTGGGTAADDLDPAYVPDGTAVVWSSGGQLYESVFGGSNGRIVFSSTTDTDPTWSPDNQRLAWICGSSICAFNPDGVAISVVAGPLAGLSRIVWSPDGSVLLYSDAAGVHTIKPDGSGQVDLAGFAAGDSVGDWVPTVANTRVPMITGDRTLNSTLVADAGIWTGPGPITYTYQWERCSLLGGNGCVAIPGATSQSYTTTTPDLNASLRVFVKATAPSGSAVAASAVSGRITNPLLGTPPSIVGTLAVGGTVTAVPGSVGEGLGLAPLTFAYQWQRCDTTGQACVSIVAATAPTYVITTADSGYTLRVVVTASNTNGTATATSPATIVIGGLTPVNMVIPTVAGSATLGQTLTASPGTWSGGGGITYSYQWQRCDPQGFNCKSIPAAIAKTYVLVTDDAGATIEVAVTGSNSYGLSVAVSVPTAIVGATPTAVGPGVPASTVQPRVVGLPTVGSTLTATRGGFVGAGLVYKYQWQRCDTAGTSCASISGAAAGTYSVAQADVGSTVRVLVTATNPLGSASAVSDTTSVVTVAPASTKSAKTTSSTRARSKRHVVPHRRSHAKAKVVASKRG
jgi:hypothetical protein